MGNFLSYVGNSNKTKKLNLKRNASEYNIVYDSQKDNIENQEKTKLKGSNNRVNTFICKKCLDYLDLNKDTYFYKDNRLCERCWHNIKI